MFICGRNIHIFEKLRNRMFQEEVNFWGILGQVKGGSGLFDNWQNLATSLEDGHLGIPG